MFEQMAHYHPREAHGYLPLYRRHGFEVVGVIEAGAAGRQSIRWSERAVDVADPYAFLMRRDQSSKRLASARWDRVLLPPRHGSG
jgi:hypothetical protein